MGHGWMKAIGRDLKRLCSKKHQLEKMVWPFSSSNAQPEVVEQERAGYECAPYCVLETAEDYQVRRYPSTKWATVTMTRSQQTPNKSFMKLFGYISGANEEEENEEGGPLMKEEMGFYVPTSHQESPPKPKGEVTIVTRPEMTVFVRTFGGFAKDNGWEKQRDQLMASLRGREDFEAINTKEYYRVGYDAPFKFWNRKNEVFVVKSD